MNRREARNIIEQGIGWTELREMMLHEYDGKPSLMFREYTRSEAHLYLRSQINDFSGMVDKDSWTSTAAEMILQEFGGDRSDRK